MAALASNVNSPARIWTTLLTCSENKSVMDKASSFGKVEREFIDWLMKTVTRAAYIEVEISN